MAVEYAKVLDTLSCSYTVIGRSVKSCKDFFKLTNVQAIEGGVEKYLQTEPAIPKCAIVSVGVESLSEVAILLLNYGVSSILLEKPGVGYASEIQFLAKLTSEKGALVFLAYNRRFYASVIKAKELIENDGGVSSFQFEFTEWSHSIKNLKKTITEHNNWFLGNSSHVIDTAFYLGGSPTEISAYHKGGLDWHPASSVFAGAGVSDKGALFSYNANWEAPGRWVLEVLTKKHRFIFKPMEKLQVQDIGSTVVNFVEFDESLDTQFKPGLYLQTKAFINAEYSNFLNIHEQMKMIESVYRKMSNYK